MSLHLIDKTMATPLLQTPATGKRLSYTKHALRIDMTPLVDLGFLLITFFIFTTKMAESKALRLIVPADATDNSVNNAAESTALSVLLGKDNRDFVYEGKWEDAVQRNQVETTNYNLLSGLGSLIRAKQKWLDKSHTQGRKALVYIIKPSPSSSFQNVVDALDEVSINAVSHYALAPLSNEEKEFMKDR